MTEIEKSGSGARPKRIYRGASSAERVRTRRAQLIAAAIQVLRECTQKGSASLGPVVCSTVPPEQSEQALLALPAQRGTLIDEIRAGVPHAELSSSIIWPSSLSRGAVSTLRRNPDQIAAAAAAAAAAAVARRLTTITRKAAAASMPT